MPGRYRRSIFDELEDMRAYMDYLFQHTFEQNRVPLLGTGEPSDILTVYRNDMRVDVTEHDDEVIVTVDMIPGVGKKDIVLDLVNPRTLRITCERQAETKEEKEGYFMRERTFGSMQRIVPLPRSVTEAGAKSTYKNGVLEIHLKTAKPEEKSRILIE